MYSEEYFKSLSNSERIDLLESNADNISEGEYIKPLTEEELTSERKRLTELSIEQSLIMEDFKNIKRQFKDKLNPLQLLKENLIQILKIKGYTETGKLYEFYSSDGQSIETYNTEGTLVSVRNVRNEEKGRTLKFKAASE